MFRKYRSILLCLPANINSRSLLMLATVSNSKMLSHGPIHETSAASSKSQLRARDRANPSNTAVLRRASPTSHDFPITALGKINLETLAASKPSPSPSICSGSPRGRKPALCLPNCRGRCTHSAIRRRPTVGSRAAAAHCRRGNTEEYLLSQHTHTASSPRDAHSPERQLAPDRVVRYLALCGDFSVVSSDSGMFRAYMGLFVECVGGWLFLGF